ncbi:protease-4 [Treponema bryantii]|uniref:Protease-4 n=1 Tax=Treponema bryantii TaxID=163 RepID=A0A1H9I352_9SPIR|nr:signal peptide peptidase SppA [Treponema bryantii]SEQ68855.1 protease-4 [Treponema bryantii]
MKKSTKSGLIVLIMLLIIIGGYVGYTVWKMNQDFSSNVQSANGSYRIAEDSDAYDPNAAKEYKRNFIAAIYIEGTISEANQNYNQKWLMNTIQTLKRNNKNAALAVFINSPGGAVYQADEVYLALNDYKTTGRPVYVYQGPLAASGGYYISCAGTKIYANRNTLTGSIGVMMGTSFDLTGLFEKIGIKSKTIHSGKNKNMMNYNEPFTEEQQAIMQSMCDECYDQFVSIVAKNRGIQYNTCCKISDGRLYTAKQALDLRLIDAIDSWDNMLRDLAEKELKMPGIKVNTYKYQKKSSGFIQILSGKALELENARAAAQLGVPVEVMKSMNETSMLPMYLAPIK